MLAPQNKGVKKNSLTPLNEIIESMRIGIDGVSEAHKFYLENMLSRYFKVGRIPEAHQTEIRELFAAKAQVTANIFGGNPEMREDIADLIIALKDMGYVVDLTTVGARFITDPGFIDQLLENPPNTLALSFDDIKSVEELNRLLDMTLGQLAKEYRSTDPKHGQARKAVATIFASKYVAEHNLPSTILYNAVIHEGNVRHANEMYRVMIQTFPKAVINPYAEQSAFLYEPGHFSEEGLELFEKFVGTMIERHLGSTPGFTKRSISG